MWIQCNNSDDTIDEIDCLISDVYGNKLIEVIEKFCKKSINDIIDNETYIWSWLDVKSPFDNSIDISEILYENLNSNKKESKQLTEDHKVQNYKGFELDWDTDEIDDEEGTATFNVYIRYNGEDLHTAHGFR